MFLSILTVNSIWTTGYTICNSEAIFFCWGSNTICLGNSLGKILGGMLWKGKKAFSVNFFVFVVFYFENYKCCDILACFKHLWKVRGISWEAIVIYNHCTSTYGISACCFRKFTQLTCTVCTGMFLKWKLLVMECPQRETGITL